MHVHVQANLHRYTKHRNRPSPQGGGRFLLYTRLSRNDLDDHGYVTAFAT